MHHTEYNDGSEPEIKGIEDCLERIRAERDEPALPLSNRFWDEYEEIKNYRETSRHRLTEQSIEQRAINNLKSLLALEGMDVIIPYKDFIRTLLEDILDYGTLSDYTLRRIANLDVNQADRMLEEIKRLKRELGEDYLYREKERLKALSKEIIIAIENRT